MDHQEVQSPGNPVQHCSACGCQYVSDHRCFATTVKCSKCKKYGHYTWCCPRHEQCNSDSQMDSASASYTEMSVREENEVNSNVTNEEGKRDSTNKDEKEHWNNLINSIQSVSNCEQVEPDFATSQGDVCDDLTEQINAVNEWYNDNGTSGEPHAQDPKGRANKRNCTTDPNTMKSRRNKRQYKPEQKPLSRRQRIATEMKSRIEALCYENKMLKAENDYLKRDNMSLRDSIEVFQQPIREEAYKIEHLERSLAEVKEELMKYKKTDTDSSKRFDELLNNLNQTKAELQNITQENVKLNAQRSQLFKYAKKLEDHAMNSTTRLKHLIWQHGYIVNLCYNDSFEDHSLLRWDGQCGQCGSGQRHTKRSCLARGFTCHGCKGNHFTSVCKNSPIPGLDTELEENDLMASVGVDIAKSQ